MVFATGVSPADPPGSACVSPDATVGGVTRSRPRLSAGGRTPRIDPASESGDRAGPLEAVDGPHGQPLRASGRGDDVGSRERLGQPRWKQPEQVGGCDDAPCLENVQQAPVQAPPRPRIPVPGAFGDRPPDLLFANEREFEPEVGMTDETWEVHELIEQVERETALRRTAAAEDHAVGVDAHEPLLDRDGIHQHHAVRVDKALKLATGRCEARGLDLDELFFAGDVHDVAVHGGLDPAADEGRGVAGLQCRVERPLAEGREVRHDRRQAHRAPRCSRDQGNDRPRRAAAGLAVGYQKSLARPAGLEPTTFRSAT